MVTSLCLLGCTPALAVDHSGTVLHVYGRGYAVASSSGLWVSHRGKQYMYTVISDLINDVNDCGAQQFLKYLGSAGFIVPLVVFLL